MIRIPSPVELKDKKRRIEYVKKLFVGSLAWGTTDETLKAHFVEFENDAEGDAAIEKLNNSELDGRTVTVNEARPRE